MMNLDRETEVVLQAVREASALVAEVYATNFSVEYKHAREPVTLADRRSNEVLSKRISDAFPSDGIVAEESVPEDPAELARMLKRERLWLIDPLDGTKEFIARNGEFAIMVGLAVQGRPVLGVVATPDGGDVWVGVTGKGTTRISRDGTRHACTPSEVSKLSDASLVVSRSHRSQALLDKIEALGAARHVPCGSVGIKASRVACGAADMYVYLHVPGGAKIWDGCAPEALVLGAGGAVTNGSGAPINYAAGPLELTGGLVASNGLLHAALIEKLQTAPRA
jgi:3'(2'), 5'-bisphosphate nucleotidase